MNSIHKRALLYGGAALVLGTLATLWHHRTTDADVMTLLSSADVQLRLAHGIPERGKDGQVLDSRERMIATAVEHLTQAERIQPGMAVTAEFVGFSHMLRGEYAEAAASYGRARECADCGDEQRDVLAFNQARMLAKAGRLEDALAVFGAHGAALDGRFGHQRAIEEAAILRQLARPDEAAARLDGVLQDASADPMACLQVGVAFLELGRVEQADLALERAAAAIPFANYHRARLKLSVGEVDTCLGLLQRAAKAQPAEVRRWLSKEATAWSAVAADARFTEITSSEPAAPAR